MLCAEYIFGPDMNSRSFLESIPSHITKVTLFPLKKNQNITFLPKKYLKITKNSLINIRD